jgi:hypothetical protein
MLSNMAEYVVYKTSYYQYVISITFSYRKMTIPCTLVQLYDRTIVGQMAPVEGKEGLRNFVRSTNKKG